MSTKFYLVNRWCGRYHKVVLLKIFLDKDKAIEHVKKLISENTDHHKTFEIQVVEGEE